MGDLLGLIWASFWLGLTLAMRIDWRIKLIVGGLQTVMIFVIVLKVLEKLHG